MTTRRTARPLLAAGAIAAGCADFDWPEVVRVVAVSTRQHLDHAGSYEAFREEMEARLDSAAAFLATGTDDEGRPVSNVVVLPDHVTLRAAFIGPRGAAARTAGTWAEALAALRDAYAGPASTYDGRFPGAGAADHALLAATDTVARAFFGTFPALATERGVWLAACAPLPELAETSDPEEVVLFADPDLDPPAETAFVARGPSVYDQCLLFGPDGTETLRVAKTVLAPAESLGGLGLTPGPLPEEVTVAALPFGRVALAPGDDASDSRISGRLAADRAALVLAPYASFGPYAAWDDLGRWVPERRQGALLAALTDPAVDTALWVASPVLTGNLFDLAFDGQGVLARRHPDDDDPPGALVGVEPEAGMVIVGPWAVVDPVLEDPTLTLDERREALAAASAARAPGSGSPEEGDYLHSVVYSDVSIGAEGVAE